MILRQSVIRHADVSMITMTWEPTSVFPIADFQNVQEFTHWNRLYDWQKERSRDLMELGVLVDPYLGVPFREGRYHGVGAADQDHAIGSEGADELMAMGVLPAHG
ncbi:Uu.00g125930.m01.CDS01 [Anthostomella pinea]|uniref:Uu.00g125930.m01.CDS01 n=1 Tax=Anthostomella pinea TaxID=933095 RepID=A0AAI8VIX6_9PEZI|nr:Uu.00g125930.m01.CDS01 [Anthostomella pinea]